MVPSITGEHAAVLVDDENEPSGHALHSVSDSNVQFTAMDEPGWHFEHVLAKA